VAPVGSNLVTISAEDISKLGANTVQQVLKSVPAVVGLNSPGQGAFGSFDGSGTNAPTIHSLGASASNSTLILLNGHRLPVGGANHLLADPNIIPPMMLQRVEVLSDGASSVYGSDAVAGVINFITRRNLDGVELNVQKGFGEQYGTLNAGAAFGKTWDSGSFILGYAYSKRDNLSAGDRAFSASPNLVARGGFNFLDNFCGPTASLVSGGKTYYSPYTSGAPFIAGSVSNPIANQNGQCGYPNAWDLIPSELRHNAMASIRQEVGDALTVTADLVYSNRENVQRVSRGNATGTVYRSGAPAGNANNPFGAAAFASLTTAGAPVFIAGTGATSATVNFNGDALLGPGASITGRDETYYGRLDLEYKLSDAWNVNLGTVIGRDVSSVESFGRINASGFQLALNGKASATINGVVNTVSQPLTAANALDVFGTAGTSPATLATLTDSRTFQQGNTTLVNVYGKVDGDLFNLPGGRAKIAIGGEYTRYKLVQDTVQPNGLGAASFNSLAYVLDYGRNVKSGYAELYLPLIGPDQHVPGVFRFDLNISGRIDTYSDVGTTKNPKIAANWEVIEGVRLRGNWARSFVAPALTSIGSNAQGRTGESNFTGGPSVTLPYSIFPSAATVPGCVSTATSCTLLGVNGIQLNGGNANLVPQRGKAWSVGVDIAPRSLRGLRVAVTYWHNELRGGITAPQLALVTGSSALSQYLTVYPSGATAAQIAALTASLPQTGTVGSPIYFIYSNQQQNVLNLNVEGIDVAASYKLETGSAGNFTFGVGLSRKTKFDQFFGAAGQGGTVFSVLGYAGYNLTFPSLKYEGRYSLGWEMGNFDANVFVNHTGGYINYGNPVNARVLVGGLPSSGGDPVKSFVTVDTHLAYTLTEMGFLHSAQIYLDTNNLLNTPPPFYNTYGLNNAIGYDGTNANPIGRVITVGLKTKL
ncbi:MAG: TonB-dependent receptor, partial [Croceibacterium sp.]